MTVNTDWGISSAATMQAEKAIRKVTDDTTISEAYPVKLHKNITKHKEQIKNIATQRQILINFHEDNAEQLSMILKG